MHISIRYFRQKVKDADVSSFRVLYLFCQLLAGYSSIFILRVWWHDIWGIAYKNAISLFYNYCATPAAETRNTRVHISCAIYMMLFCLCQLLYAALASWCIGVMAWREAFRRLRWARCHAIIRPHRYERLMPLWVVSGRRALPVARGLTLDFERALLQISMRLVRGHDSAGGVLLPTAHDIFPSHSALRRLQRQELIDFRAMIAWDEFRRACRFDYY